MQYQNTEERGKRFRHFRTKYIHEKTRRAAALLGWTHPYISRVESGSLWLSPDKITQLVRDYSLNLEWLLTGNGTMQIENAKPTAGSSLTEAHTEIRAMKALMKAKDANINRLFNLVERMATELENVTKRVEALEGKKPPR